MNKMVFHTVRRRVKNVFRLRRPLAQYLRGVLAGATVAFAMAETIAYYQIKNSVVAGDLPWFTLDAVVVSLALVESASCPWLAMVGRGRRRAVLLAGTLAPAALALIALATPGVDTAAGTDLCGVAVEPRAAGTSWRAWGRLMTLVLLATGTAISRAAVWIHGLAYLDDHEPHQMVHHIGFLVAMRFVGLAAIPRALSHSTLGVSVAGVAAPLLLHAAQLLLVPSSPPHTPSETQHKDPSPSLRRVVRSPAVLWQVLAAILLAAALWGFGYHESDIIKSQFLQNQPENFLAGQAVVIRTFVLVLTIILVAKSNSPIDPHPCNKAALSKLATIVTALTVPLFVLMVTVARCERGLLASGSHSYQPANCTSCQCGEPWLEFNPVCVTDSLTTYYSPCHAGCTRRDTVGGIQAYSSCSCAAGGPLRATTGACGAASEQCAGAMFFFQTLYLLVLALSVTAFQSMGVNIIRATNVSDRATVLGLTAAALAAGTFAGGHALYRAIAVSTCSWIQNGRCNLQSPSFPYIVGAVSGALALLSAAISLVTWLRLRPRKAPLDESPSH